MADEQLHPGTSTLPLPSSGGAASSSSSLADIDAYDRDPDPAKNSVSVEEIAALVAGVVGPTMGQPIRSGSLIFRGDPSVDGPQASSGYTPRSLPYATLRYSSDTGYGTGLAFDVRRAVETLDQSCTETYGKCRAHVLDAIDQRGEIRTALTKGGYDVGAKHIADVLQNDSNLSRIYSQVGSGYGANLSSAWDYKAKAGDICVWDGGEWGHVMMCVGKREDGSPIWRADFTAREGNWTGLKDPNSHGTFHIFRQRGLDDGAKADLKSTQSPANDHPQDRPSLAPRGFSPPH